MAEPAQEFIPSPRTKDCSKKPGGWGLPMADYEYIWYGNKGEDDYPEDACRPFYHKSAQIDDFRVNTTITGACDITITGEVTAPKFNGVATSAKTISGSFDIPHVKDEKKRIRHVIAEGPEAGIYVRGTLKDSNKIELPEYWDGLIDPETITVTLTQIGYSQDLIVDSIEWGKVVNIKSGVGTTINCYYEIWAARYINPMDHSEKLHVVYEGDTPDDYPGNNECFFVGGWDYDRRETKWRRPEGKMDSVNLDTDA
ncbi:MAG: hypothetical protein ACXAC2_15380 [Candidatus Kariarchaeaceae archaeon]|jgi:hypothetical protein